MNEVNPLPRPAYEPKDAQTRVVAATAAAMAVIVAIGLVVAAAIHAAALRRGGRGPSLDADASFQHGAQARTSVAESWDEIDQAARRHLDGYAWVDRQQGIVRIPIDRAIDLVCAGSRAAAPGTGGRGTTP